MGETPNEKLNDLLRATAQGDAQAFKSLYDETSPRLHAVALAMMRDSGLAEDVLQDAFVQVWHRAGDYHGERGSVFTWLTTIVRYRAIDMLRKRGHDGANGKTRPIDVNLAEIDLLQRGHDGNDDTRELGPLARSLKCRSQRHTANRMSARSAIKRAKRRRAGPRRVPRTYAAAR